MRGSGLLGIKFLQITIFIQKDELSFSRERRVHRMVGAAVVLRKIEATVWKDLRGLLPSTRGASVLLPLNKPPPKT